METYLILRRGAWRDPRELQEAGARSRGEAERAADDVRWLRSYVLAETDGALGTVCVFQASSPEALRAHAYRAGLPVDEIVAIADTLIVRPDPAAVAACVIDTVDVPADSRPIITRRERGER
jgi:hypothetical protein